MKPFHVPRSRALLTAADYAHLAEHPLLSPAAENPKTLKGLADFPILASIMHLAPARNSGYLVCTHASPGCGGAGGHTGARNNAGTMVGACIYVQGQAGVFPSINQCRIRKTRYFVEAHALFMHRLAGEIWTRVETARAAGLLATFRLNATSDIPWERIPVTVGGATYANLMSAFPAAAFYDYTKVVDRLRGPLPDNYHLTFSLSESNDAHALEALDRGYNVAAVVNVPKRHALPATFGGYPVIDGDTHDYRLFDPAPGYIVGLRPKGTAKHDTSGFVHPVNYQFDRGRALTFATAEPTAYAAD